MSRLLGLPLSMSNISRIHYNPTSCLRHPRPLKEGRHTITRACRPACPPRFHATPRPHHLVTFGPWLNAPNVPENRNALHLRGSFLSPSLFQAWVRRRFLLTTVAERGARSKRRAYYSCYLWQPHPRCFPQVVTMDPRPSECTFLRIILYANKRICPLAPARPPIPGTR